MITLLDYGAGNVRSIINALESLGETVVPVNTPAGIDGADRLVFPGVGNFGAMMHTLRQKQLVEPLLRYLNMTARFLVSALPCRHSLTQVKRLRMNRAWVFYRAESNGSQQIWQFPI